MTDREHLLLDFASELMPLTGHLSEVALVVPLHYQRLGKACRALSEGLRRWARRGLTPADLVDAEIGRAHV